MIEAMEQQIINAINSRWTKDKDKRREINIDKISECFRVICSSRNSNYAIIKKITIDNKALVIDELIANMEWIYDWITGESIKSLLAKYETELKDKKKENEYKAEIPMIKESLNKLKTDLINETIKKLLEFNSIDCGE